MGADRQKADRKGEQMTREEAIKTIESAKRFTYDGIYDEAFDMAISALSIIIKLENMTEMYAQKGHAPTRTISMEDLRDFIKE